MRDASLDEFLSTDEASEDGNEGATGDDRADLGSEPEAGPEAEPSQDTGTDEGRPSDSEGLPPVGEVDPARSTFAWSPDGAACAECGERVEERWEADAGLVCVGCKSW